MIEIFFHDVVLESVVLQESRNASFTYYEISL